MYDNNRNVPGGGKPTEERKREYAQGHAVGKVLFGMEQDEQQVQEMVAEEGKKSVPDKRPEIWPYPLRKNGTRRPGHREVEVCRSAKGRFANLSRERAAHFGIMTGRDVPPPARRTG